VDEQAEGVPDRVPDDVHRSGRLCQGVLCLSGVGHEERSAELLDSEPAIVSCASGETIQSAKATPPSVLTRSPAAFVMSIT
jgi:hypothetical protein